MNLPKFFVHDAAIRIVELIEEEEDKLKFATRKRDQHRGETTIRALTEALELVLLERLCKEDGEPHPMPNTKEFIKEVSQRGQAPAV